MPEALDAYSGEGGVTRGLLDAGWNVTAIDNDPNRLARNPAPIKILVDDAVPWILEHGHRFDYGHGSPPCTGYTQATSSLPDRVARYGRMIGATRAAFLEAGIPYTIENVVSKVTRAELRNPVLYCWTHFREPGTVHDTDGTPLWMRRHRLIESNLPLMDPGPCRHPRGMQCAGAYGGARRDKHEARYIRKGGYTPAGDVMRALVEVPWMTETGCKLAIPPFYAEHYGTQILEQLTRAA